MDDDTLWGFGLNASGQLGLGDINFTSTATPIIGEASKDVKAVAAGQFHSLVLRNDGTVWAFGFNTVGQLGFPIGSGIFKIASQVTDLSHDVQAIAVNGASSLVLKKDGTVWAFGSNDNGQLGLGNNTNTSTAKQIISEANKGVQAIAAGGNYSLFLKSDGSLWAFGGNENGQLGLGTTAGTNIATQVLALGNSVQSISGGGGHTMVIKKDGTLWAFGGNNNGQLGLGNRTNTSTPTRVDIP